MHAAHQFCKSVWVSDSSMPVSGLKSGLLHNYSSVNVELKGPQKALFEHPRTRAQAFCPPCSAAAPTWWYSCEPWEKLKRATLIPARSNSSKIGTDRLFGPNVQTICAFLLGQ